ncbi:MAG: hypothetical protein KatS3mg119_0347 [Rhodothalassiaceae bacterium]|nr:MAG: hypothetical protein KatS3mg119_0347 [Rhodothalassiaceae bacterium]
MMTVLRIGAAALAAALFAATGGAARAHDAPRIEEWTVPWEGTRPRDPAVAPDGRIWFVGQRGHYLATLDPATGRFWKRDLSDSPGPHNVVVGSDGIVWYTGNLKGYIGRYDPAADTIERIAMPDPQARDPHTLIFAPGGRVLWFTVQGGNRIGRLEIASRRVELVTVPSPRARPYGIAIAGDGHVWVALFGTNRLAEIDPASKTLTEHPLPNATTRPRRIAAVRENGEVAIYYGDYANGRLGRYLPGRGRISEWELPGGPGSRPYALAADGRGRIWVAETGLRPNRLVAFDPAGGSFVHDLPVPSGGGTIRHMVYDPKADAIWFGTDANTIGRLLLGP